MRGGKNLTSLFSKKNQFDQVYKTSMFKILPLQWSPTVVAKSYTSI